MNGILERSISKTKKSNLRFLYGQAVVSTMILIDMKCKHSRDCNDASFIATTNSKSILNQVFVLCHIVVVYS